MGTTSRRGTQALAQRLGIATLRWWAKDLLVCVVALTGAIAAVLAREPTAVTIALLATVVVAGTGGIRARDEFRRGWRYGYESATRVMMEHAVGRTSDIAARAIVRGDPTPEPWDTHTRVRIPRSLR